MKRVLIVTSKRLEETVREIVSEAPNEYRIEVLGLPVDVVALLTPNALKRQLLRELGKRGLDVKSFDFVLVSGMIPGDLKPISEELGVKVLKGTKTLNELKVAIRKLNELEDKLSFDKPLEDELREYVLEEVAKELQSIDFEKAFDLNGFEVPLRPPPVKVVAEVMDKGDLEEKLSKASEVTSFVVIGSTSTSPNPSKLPSLLKLAEKYFKVVALDSMFWKELNEGCKLGFDVAFSIDRSKIGKVKCDAVVVIPGDIEKGYWPSSPEEKVKSLLENLREVKSEKVFIDPVLSPPPNTLASLIAYYDLSKKVKLPLIMGISNFTELVDFDSVGTNATLIQLAAESGVSLVMVTEESDKARSSWYESAIASVMSTISLHRKTPPKDLGTDLLILKEKKIDRLIYFEEGEEIEARDQSFPLEESVVRIWIDGDGVKASVVRGREKYLVKGDPYLIGKTLIAKGLVKEPSHALYLGWELHKAYLAWKQEKSYIQEMPLKCPSSKEKWEELKEFFKGQL
ncbi:hypothetical protein EYM_07160 [Ignicoccus islandicus DSM 13165]|uniref:Dihydropteroate synthase n=1 Tax=Ignicoccus islandicus DSM 13165 TaxID=940295 RepID=A0A0U2VFI0_9CREN|nr:dihydropteroate synthase-like protein [Ignicoccus islandicus]ALU12754.1 hypothetical protein EYM_07160 [Ignicoccus islandicus DSM 13165]